jgi:hypothetical protein
VPTSPVIANVRSAPSPVNVNVAEVSVEVSVHIAYCQVLDSPTTTGLSSVQLPLDGDSDRAAACPVRPHTSCNLPFANPVTNAVAGSQAPTHQLLPDGTTLMSNAAPTKDSGLGGIELAPSVAAPPEPAIALEVPPVLVPPEPPARLEVPPALFPPLLVVPVRPPVPAGLPRSADLLRPQEQRPRPRIAVNRVMQARSTTPFWHTCLVIGSNRSAG